MGIDETICPACGSEETATVEESFRIVTRTCYDCGVLYDVVYEVTIKEIKVQESHLKCPECGTKLVKALSPVKQVEILTCPNSCKCH